MEENFRVPVTKIKALHPHPNPKVERLEIATVFDFNVVVRKNQYKLNDTVIYVPIDSVLTTELEAKIFGPNSKIKLNKSRVRQIRIQQFPSQGMLIDPTDTGLTDLEEGQNLAEVLKITKYEPELPDYQENTTKVKKERNKSYENPYFHQYGGLLNVKWYPEIFVEGQEVVYQEKIHGSNGRASLSPNVPKTLLQKIIHFLGLTPKHTFCYGSNTVQLQAKSYTGYYDNNIYGEMCKKYDIANKLKPNETVYFEIYGDGIQKGYTYGCAQGERKIVVFDVKVLSQDQKSTQWLNANEVEAWCKERDLPMVPIIYKGPHSKEKAKECTLGNSLIGEQLIREGIVIKDPNETVNFIGKKFLKQLSEDYLDLDTSDFH